MILLETNSTYYLYGGNIPAVAGQVAELRISSLPSAAFPFYSLVLDDIQFSPQVIAEPSALGLFGVGALLLGWRWHKARKS
jgi:hypothetical protein